VLAMSVEDQLILEAERRGLGLDLNFLRGTFTVELGRNQGRKRKFASLEAALNFVLSK